MILSLHKQFEMNGNPAIDVPSKELIDWVTLALKNEKFTRYDIYFKGKSEKGEGYLSEIVYINVSGHTREGNREINFVIKYSKNHSYLRKVSPMKSAFRREIFVYEKVFTTFNQFQIRKNVQNLFSSIPKCYQTITLEDREVLVLDNLKIQGFELHDGKKPLNMSHLKMVLVEYGKLHALSFALRDQAKEEFKTITDCDYDFFRKFFSEASVKKTFQKIVDDAIELLAERKDFDLCKEFRKLLLTGAYFYGDMLSDLTEENEPQSAVIHGDCWNNNFMFQYENDDKTVPSKVAILDWQISGLRSPAIDLSFLIYSSSSQNELDRFEELMETYYASFSQFLRELGSDPEKLFSYADLKRHWGKYSLFGLLFVPMVWRLVLSSKEEVPVFEELKEGEEFGSVMVRSSIEDRDAYYERLKAVARHYFNNNFK